MTNETIEKMRSLRLGGMLSAYEILKRDTKNIKMTNDEIITYLVDQEYEYREEKKIQRLTKKASFKLVASLGEIDTSPKRGFDKNTLVRLSELNWIKRAENVLITGPTGSGKTFIGNAIGHHACIGGYSVQYFMFNKLIRKHKESRLELSVSKLLRAIEKSQLLILDDLGLSPINKENCRLLFEIIDDRYGKGATIISSQYPIKLWSKLFEDKTIGDAIIDRVIHNSYKIELKAGEKSKRENNKVEK